MVDIKEALLRDRYNAKQADLIVGKLAKMDLRFQEGLNQWAKTGTEQDYVIAGVKLSELKSKYNLTYPSALLTMDWLLREPMRALASIERGIK